MDTFLNVSDSEEENDTGSTHRLASLPGLVGQVDGADGTEGGDGPVAPALDRVQVEGHGGSRGVTAMDDEVVGTTEVGDST